MYKFKSTVAALVCVLFGTNTAMGEVNGLFDDILFEPPTVVSASRYEQKIMDAPSAISVISKDEILRAPVHNVPDLLQYVVGMDGFTKTYSDMDFSARGLSGDESSKTLTLIDGEPVYAVVTSGMMWPQLPLTLEEIERIEIIRGPASSVYGANALIGVINIITKRVKDRANKASMLIGERGTTFGDLHWARMINDKTGLAVNYGYRQGESKGDKETPEAETAAPNYGIKDWTDVHLLGYKLEYDPTEDRSYTISGGISQGDDGYNPSPGDPQMDLSEKRTVYMNNKLEQQLGDDSIMVRFGYRDMHQRNRKWMAASSEYVLKYTVEKSYGIDFDAMYTLRSRGNTLICGTNLASYRGSRNIRNDITDPTNPVPYQYDSTNNLLSLFVQDQVSLLNDRLSFVLGGRYDKWTTNDPAFTPKAAANISFFEKKLVWRVAYGTAFTGPGFDANYYYTTWPGGWFKGSAVTETTEDGVTIQGVQLKPQTMYSYETGIRALPKRNWLADYIDLELFNHRIKDLFDTVPAYAGALGVNVMTQSNKDEIEISGAELEIKKQYSKRFASFLNYTAQYADYVPAVGVRRQYKGAPRNKVSAGISYLGAVTVDLRGRYVSAALYEGNPVEEYGSVDIALSKSFRERYFVKLGIINLLDNSHYEYPLYTKITRKAMLSAEYQF